MRTGGAAICALLAGVCLPAHAAGSLRVLYFTPDGPSALYVKPASIDRMSGALSVVGAGVPVHPGAFGICNYVVRAAAPTAFVGIEEVVVGDEYVFHVVTIDAATGSLLRNVSGPSPGWAEVASAWDDITSQYITAGFRQPAGTEIDIVALDAGTGNGTLLAAAIPVQGIQVCEGDLFPGPSGAADGEFFFLTIAGVTEELVSFDMAAHRARKIPLPNVDGIVTGYSGITAYQAPTGNLLAALVYNGIGIGPTEVILVDPTKPVSNVTRVARSPDFCYVPASQGSAAVDPATGTFFFLLLHFGGLPGGQCAYGKGAPAQPVLIEVDLARGGWKETNITGVTVPTDTHELPLTALDWVA